VAVKILAPFKRVPDLGTGGVPLTPNNGSTWTINPFDEIALEEAVRLKERGLATAVVAVTVGTVVAEEQARAAFARGADRVIRVDEGRALDPYAVARILRAVALREAPQLILMGKQAVDDDCNQTGQRLAGLLGWPQATFVSRVELLEGARQARCTRETDRGLETILVRLPAVLTTDLRLNEPRYVSLPGLLRARRQSIETVSCRELGVDARPRTALLATLPAPKRPTGTRVQSIDELLAKLREVEKVL
jgi:electron transfer flavoprotein beta subunit